MSDISKLKTKLVDYLLDQLEHPGEDGVPGNVLTTASKMVKDFSHEIEPDNSGAMAIKDAKLAAFLAKRPAAGAA